MAPIIEIKTHKAMGKWTNFFEVPSESDPDRAYIVSSDTDFRNLGCSCPAWIHHTPRRNCKHIQRLLRERVLAASSGRGFVTNDVMPTRTSPEKLARLFSHFANIDIS